MIPEGWKLYKLSEIVADVAMGPFGSNLKVDNFISKGVPVIRGSNLNQGGLNVDDFVFVSEEKANSLKRSLAYPNDLVFTHRGTIGQVGIIPHNKYPYYLVSQSQMRLSVKKEYLDSKFLYYFFLSPFGQRELLKNASQVGVPAIANPTKSLKDVNVLVPPLAEQSHIASILSSLDDKIELNLQMNKTLEAIAQAIFKEWFVDFRFPGFDGELVDGLPKGWRKTEIKEIIYVQNGYAFKSSYFKDLGTNGIIKIKNISGNLVDIDNVQNIEESTALGIDQRFKVSSYDLLIAMTGAEVGKIGFVPKTHKNLWLNQRVGMFKEKVKYSKWFAYLILSRPDYQSILFSTAVGSAQPNISATQIESIETIIPPKDLIETFGELINPMMTKICDNYFENYLLREIRDNLLPKLMTGKIRVA